MPRRPRTRRPTNLNLGLTTVNEGQPLPSLPGLWDRMLHQFPELAQNTINPLPRLKSKFRIDLRLGRRLVATIYGPRHELGMAGFIVWKSSGQNGGWTIDELSREPRPRTVWELSREPRPRTVWQPWQERTRLELEQARLGLASMLEGLGPGQPLETTTQSNTLTPEATDAISVVKNEQPNEARMLVSNRTYGIELEINKPTEGPHTGLSAAGLARLLEDAGVSCRAEGYNHRDSTTHWKIVSDQTVPAGYELVSPILKGEDGLAQIKKVTDVLGAAKYRVDRSTGFHVHVGYAGMTVQERVNVMLRYGAFKSELEWFFSKSRRSGQNTMTMDVARFINVPELKDVSLVPVPMQGRYDAARSEEDRHWRRVTENHIGTRYVTVNLMAWQNGHPTIEFRQHQGTIDYEKITNWVKFVIAFVEYTIAKARHQVVAPVPMDVLSKVRKMYRGEVTKAWQVADLLLSTSSRGYSRLELSRMVNQGETQISVILGEFRKRGYGLVETKIPRPDNSHYKLYRLVPPMMGTVAVLPVEDAWSHGIPNEVVGFYKARQTHFRNEAGATTSRQEAA